MKQKRTMVDKRYLLKKIEEERVGIGNGAFLYFKDLIEGAPSIDVVVDINEQKGEAFGEVR